MGKILKLAWNNEHEICGQEQISESCIQILRKQKHSCCGGYSTEPC